MPHKAKFAGIIDKGFFSKQRRGSSERAPDKGGTPVEITSVGERRAALLPDTFTVIVSPLTGLHVERSRPYKPTALPRHILAMPISRPGMVILLRGLPASEDVALSLLLRCLLEMVVGFDQVLRTVGICAGQAAHQNH